MAEVRRGGDFLFNVNSLSSPYVAGGPKSLISRRGSYFSITFLLVVLRFTHDDVCGFKVFSSQISSLRADAKQSS